MDRYKLTTKPHSRSQRLKTAMRKASRKFSAIIRVESSVPDKPQVAETD